MASDSVRQLKKASLRCACISGNTAGLNEIFQQYPDLVWARFLINVFEPRMQAQEATGLHLAAFHGNEKCCDVLLDAGADIEAKDERGRTPLMFARHIRVVRLLLVRGASVHARDRLSMTVLHYQAFLSKAKECVEALLSAGASATAEDALRRTPLKILINRNRYSTVSEAQDLDVGVLMVKARADANTRAESTGNTLLHLCSGESPGDVRGERVSQRLKYLKSAGADLDAREKRGRTPLHAAALQNNQYACAALLELGASATIKDNEGHTPLFIASESWPSTNTYWALLDNAIGGLEHRSDQEAQKVRQKFKYGTDRCTEGAMGTVNTCFVYAAKHGLTQAAASLVQHGANVDSQTI